MITSINPKNYQKYSLFFQEAWEQLHTEHFISDDEYAVGAPTTLEEYFVYADQLKNLTDTLGKTKYKYLMLPLDEAPFEIDANTRKISIPTNFAKNGVGVQGDVIAETLFFRIDRFFDYMDLLTTDIYVQWKTPAKEDNHGVTRITTVDYESQADQGKLLLAWPLHEKVCATPGALQFSVRFIKRDNEGSAIVYSFNTLPATISINAALKSDMDYVEQDDPSDLFSSAVASSPSTSGFTPDIPAFAITGLDLGSTAYLENNTYVFRAQATANDNPNLIYEWHHVPAGSLTDEPLTKNIANDFVEVPNPVAPTAENEKVYYVVDNTAPEGYVVYAGEVFPPQNADGSTIPVYERYTTYTIVDDKAPVVGSYYVVAKNKRQRAYAPDWNAETAYKKYTKVTFEDKTWIALEDNQNQEPAIGSAVWRMIDLAKHGLSMKKSNVCSIPGPQTFTLEDLADHDEMKNPVVGINVNTKMSVVQDNKANITYTLYKSTTSDKTDFTAVDTNSSGEFVVHEAGWYKIDAETTLNRAVTTGATQTVCKVFETPVAPTVSPNPIEMDTHPLEHITLKANEHVTFTVAASMPEDKQGPLYHEQFKYVWQKQEVDADSPWTNITSTVGQEVVSGNSLTVYRYTNQKAASYRCLVTNLIGDVESEAAESGAMFVMPN